MAFRQQIFNYLAVQEEGNWLKRVKYLTTYPMALYTRNEPPKAPDVLFKPSGAVRRWMKARINAFNRKNTHLWYSWLQAKRSALPVSLNLVSEAFEKHREGLLSPPLEGETLDEIFEDRTFNTVLDRISDAVDKRIGELNDWRERMPTESACWEHTRAMGGQAQALSVLTGGSQDDVLDTELYSMAYCRVLVRSRIVFRVLEKRSPKGAEEWEAMPSWYSAPRGHIRCLVQAVLEPLKVRVITKEEALPGYQARPLQRILHDVMRSMPCFRLIGRPACPTDLIDLQGSEDDEWFNIDYSAATDGLSWSYSQRILERLVPPSRLPLYERVLGPHELWYPKNLEKGSCFENRWCAGVQTTGQLMGSILSFPILCLANLGVYLRVTRGRIKKRLRRVLINGDDMVYKAPADLWERHVQVGRCVGLEMSAGKAYRHPVFVNINSTCFHYRHGETPWQINYLNSGLFFNRHKVQSKETSGCLASIHTRDDGIVGNLNVLLDGCLPGRHRQVFVKYLSRHEEEIKRACAVMLHISNGADVSRVLHSRNIWLPKSLGGMGVRPPPFVHLKRSTTRLQRILASTLAESMDPFPLPGYECEKFDALLDRPWWRRHMVPDEEIPTLRIKTGRTPLMVEHAISSSCRNTFVL